jgi:putative oxidoreductase
MPVTHRIHHDRHEAVITNHAAYIYFAIRLIAGFLLMLKGIYFVSHTNYLENAVTQATNGSSVDFLVNYIGFAHVFGGAFIMLGLLTRFAVILQLPIVVAAFFYNMTPEAFGSGGELILSLVVLVMLVYILYRGSGPVSMDDYLKKHLL